MNRLPFSSSVDESPGFPAPFVEEALLCPLYVPAALINSQRVANTWTRFWLPVLVCCFMCLWLLCLCGVSWGDTVCSLQPLCTLSQDGFGLRQVGGACLLWFCAIKKYSKISYISTMYLDYISPPFPACSPTPLQWPPFTPHLFLSFLKLKIVFLTTYSNFDFSLPQLTFLPMSPPTQTPPH